MRPTLVTITGLLIMTKDSMSLKACAHCGSSDVELRRSITDACIACCNCGCRTGFVFYGPSDAANAAKDRELIEVWNTRASISSTPTTTCRYCENEPEPGYIEMDNNGPIVRCPACERRNQQAAPATTDEVEVKPLEWRVPEEGELGHDEALLTALGIGGSYDIAQQSDGYILWWAADAFTFKEGFASIADAQAAAEADWQKSVRAALSPAKGDQS